MKYWKVAFYGLGILPIGFTASLLSFYLSAGRILGELPSPNQPDPIELDFYSDFAPIIHTSGGIWLNSLPVWLILSVIYLIINRKNIHWMPIVISGIAQIIGIAILLSNITEWFVD